MKINQRIFIFLGFAAFCWLLVAGWAMFTGRQGSSVDPVYSDVFTAMTTNPAYVYRDDGDIPEFGANTLGAILPAPAADSAMTAKTMAALQKTWSTKLVLVISFADDLGEKAVTSGKFWQTSFGVIEVNGDAVAHLVICGAKEDDAKLATVSDFYDFAPYFAYYFPDKKMVPLVFDASVDRAYLQSFLDQLAACNDGYKVLFLTSAKANEPPLFTSAKETLAASFDGADTTSFDGVLSGVDDAALHGMKYILQYDGNDVLGVLTPDAGTTSLNFENLTVLYGKGE